MLNTPESAPAQPENNQNLSLFQLKSTISAPAARLSPPAPDAQMVVL